MKKEKLIAFLQWLSQHYQRLEDYFTNGSFGVKFYPLLMYPCVRHSRIFVLKTLAVLLVFLGIDTFFAEFIATLFTDNLVSSYLYHTPFELLQPTGTVIDGYSSQPSPLAKVMQSVFLLQGYLFFWIYLLGITTLTQRFRLLAGLFALCFAIGLAMTASAQGGKYTVGGLQNIGLSITLLCGHLCLIFTGLGVKENSLYRFKRFSLIIGTLGLIATIISLLDLESIHYLPLIERFSLYTILIWQVATGFAMLNNLRKPQEL